jgi:hypothetical protein
VRKRRDVAARVAALGLGVWCGATPVRADPVPTNYELVRATAHEACAKLVQNLRGHTTTERLTVRGVGTSPGNFLVENTLTSALTEAGFQVKTRADTANGSVVEFEVVDLGLAYPDVHRSALFGSKRVEREARARIFARLVDGERGQVVWADQAEGRRRDEVSAKQLPELEEQNPAEYVKATLPPDRWNKVVEPVVVTTIIAGLILLFFSNQN